MDSGFLRKIDETGCIPRLQTYLGSVTRVLSRLFADQQTMRRLEEYELVEQVPEIISEWHTVTSPLCLC